MSRSLAWNWAWYECRWTAESSLHGKCGAYEWVIEISGDGLFTTEYTPRELSTDPRKFRTLDDAKNWCQEREDEMAKACEVKEQPASPG